MSESEKPRLREKKGEKKSAYDRKRNNAYLAGKFSLSGITARLRAALVYVAAEMERR